MCYTFSQDKLLIQVFLLNCLKFLPIFEVYVDNLEPSIAAMLYINWSAYNGTYTTPSYHQSQRRVYLEGLLRKTGAFVAGEIIFIAPAGYRPVTRKLCSGLQPGGEALGIDVQANG
ncbi:hypothetical protein [Patiriisocius hiemis]|uniref:Uncharacterized protein n=1 Tax=Patiriisocius hiemis TaxID=3075604 RepID=A0ABU2YEK0_9FLAO|nr:hypothetical protein [Constantimarinum sp. W242]MDT0556611.1 hypothetical protein [Constantimarinum sp. W242]